MSLLMTSQPIVINRDLACRIGLNEAIVLQQLHYWLISVMTKVCAGHQLKPLPARLAQG